MIPEGWRDKVLEDGIDLISGRHVLAGDYTDQPIGIPYLTGPADFPEGKISVTKYTQKPEVICEPGDILLTVKGSGTGKLIKADQMYCISRQLMAIRVRKWNKNFVYYFLVHNNSRYEKAAAGLIPGISRGDVLQTPIQIPPLPEQCAIAAILGTWDCAIALTERRLATAEQRKKALMQQLLTGRVRFPEFAGEAWREAELGEFFREFAKRNKANNDLTVLSCSTVYGIVPQEQIFSRRIASENTERYKIVERGDLVYDPMLLWDASIGFLEVVDRGIVSPAYSTFKFREGNGIRGFFKPFIQTHYLREHYKFISQGTNVRRRKAPTKAFLALKMKVPSNPEQRRIAAVLDACDREIDLLRRKRDALQQQKKGLMQRLLTGRVRVAGEARG